MVPEEADIILAIREEVEVPLVCANWKLPEQGDDSLKCVEYSSEFAQPVLLLVRVYYHRTPGVDHTSIGMYTHMNSPDSRPYLMLLWRRICR